MPLGIMVPGIFDYDTIVLADGILFFLERAVYFGLEGCEGCRNGT